jgi:hypothetical protein
MPKAESRRRSSHSYCPDSAATSADTSRHFIDSIAKSKIAEARRDLPWLVSGARRLAWALQNRLPGRPGWLPTQAPHRPVRAGLPHTVLQATVLLRDFQTS